MAAVALQNVSRVSVMAERIRIHFYHHSYQKLALQVISALGAVIGVHSLAKANYGFNMNQLSSDGIAFLTGLRVVAVVCWNLAALAITAPFLIQLPITTRMMSKWIAHYQQDRGCPEPVNRDEILVAMKVFGSNVFWDKLREAIHGSQPYKLYFQFVEVLSEDFSPLGSALFLKLADNDVKQRLLSCLFEGLKSWEIGKRSESGTMIGYLNNERVEILFKDGVITDGQKQALQEMIQANSYIANQEWRKVLPPDWQQPLSEGVTGYFRQEELAAREFRTKKVEELTKMATESFGKAKAELVESLQKQLASNS